MGREEAPAAAVRAHRPQTPHADPRRLRDERVRRRHRADRRRGQRRARQSGRRLERLQLPRLPADARDPARLHPHERAAARYFLAQRATSTSIRHGVLPLVGAGLMVALLVGQIIEQTARPYSVVSVGDRRLDRARRGRRRVAGRRAPARARARGDAARHREAPTRAFPGRWRSCDGLRGRHRRRLAERQGAAARRGGRSPRRPPMPLRDEPSGQRLGRAEPCATGSTRSPPSCAQVRASARRLRPRTSASDRPRLPGRRPGRARRGLRPAAPGDHLARPPRDAAVRRAVRARSARTRSSPRPG